MIAIGTKKLSKLVEDGIFKLPEFLKEHKIKYIETSLDYDNDLTLHGKIPPECTVISRTQCLGDLDVTLDFHRLSLGVSADQMCVLLPDRDWSDPKVKDEVLRVHGKYKIGLDGIKEVEEIEVFKEGYGWTPDFISIEISPLCYPKSVLEYAKENNISVIGHGIFGGEIWAGYLRSMFPEGFLYDFARANVDVVVLPGDDLYFLGKILGRNKMTPLPEGKLFTYSKDIQKYPALKIPPRKIHGQTKITLEGFGDFEVPCGDLSDTYSTVKKDPKISGEVLWEDTDLPWDTPKDNIGLLSALHRYHAPVEIDSKYSPKWWKKIYTKISDDFYAIKLIPRHWYLGWWTKEHMFWLVSGKLIKTPLTGLDDLNNEY